MVWSVFGLFFFLPHPPLHLPVCLWVRGEVHQCKCLSAAVTHWSVTLSCQGNAGAKGPSPFPGPPLMNSPVLGHPPPIRYGPPGPPAPPLRGHFGPRPLPGPQGTAAAPCADTSLLGSGCRTQICFSLAHCFPVLHGL